MLNVFLVGFPRSGTTLGQQLICGEFSLYTTVETHYYFESYFCPFDRFLNPKLSDAMCFPRPGFLKDKKYESVLNEIAEDCFFVNDGASLFDVFDAVALKNRKKGWLEKTPGHVRRIPLIRKINPNAKFIHVVRDFPSVYNSWVKINESHPGMGKFIPDKDRIYRNWRRDLLRTNYWCSVYPENNFCLTYNELCSFSDVKSELENFLSVRSTSEGLYDGSQVVSDDEPWKVNNYNSHVVEVKASDFGEYKDSCSIYNLVLGETKK